MTYQELVTAALKEIDQPEAELLEFCAQNSTSLPTEADWIAFHAYADRIKLQLLICR